MEYRQVVFFLLVSCAFQAQVQAQDDVDDGLNFLPLAGKRPPMPPRNLNFSTAAASLSGSSGVYGSISFVSYNDVLYIVGVIANLTDGQHGFHIHESGEFGDDCKDIGDHYNPLNRSHSCDPSTGHLGDLGNVESIDGIAYVNKTVAGMKLVWTDGREGNGNTGVLGLSIAVDTNVDTCQAADDGNSGPPVACGVILPLFGPSGRGPSGRGASGRGPKPLTLFSFN